MKVRSSAFLTVFAFAVVSLLVPVGISGQEARAVQDSDDWCDDDWGDDRRYRHCEVRELTLAASALKVNSGINGGIAVQAWDRGDIRVSVKVTSQADSRDEAEQIANSVRVIADGGDVRADGPDMRRHRSWGTSYRIMVPRDTDLDLDTHNGGISIDGVQSTIRFEVLNGGARLEGLGGDVRGEVTNGGLRVRLTGDRWQGRGMDVHTTNGGVRLYVPENYSAELETGAVNGGIEVDFPVTVHGRINRSLKVELGDGGAPIKVKTTNGGVRVRRTD